LIEIIKKLVKTKPNFLNISSFDYESFAGWSNLTSDCKIAKYDESCDAISFSNPLEVYQSNCFNVSDQVIVFFCYKSFLDYINKYTEKAYLQNLFFCNFIAMKIRCHSSKN